MSKSITFDDFLTEVREHQSGKACYKCNEHKPLSEFYKDKWTKDGKTHKCKSCAKKYEANICRFRKWFTDKKKNAKHAGTEFIIQPEDIPGVKIRETITIDRRGRKYTSWEAVESVSYTHLTLPTNREV